MKKILQNNIIMIKYIATFCPNYIIFSIINVLISSLLSIAGILYTKYIINCVSTGVDFLFIIKVILIFLFVTIIYSIFNIWMQQIVSPRNTQILEENMQQEIFKKAAILDYKCYEDAEFYNKFSMALQQANSRAIAVLNTFSSLVGNIFTIIALIPIISLSEPFILILSGINVGLSFFININLAKINHNYYQEKIVEQRKMSYIQRIFYHRDFAKEIKLFPAFSKVLYNKFHKASLHLILLIKKYGLKLSKKLLTQGISNALFNSLLMLLLAYKVIHGFINVADFVALSAGSQQLVAQLNQFLNIFPQLYEHSVYIENFMDFMNHSSSMKSGTEILDLTKTPTIKFEDVSFSYPGTEKASINNISFTIEPGTRVAFVGKNGAGKSTIIKLISRLYDAQQGVIKINGINCDNYDIMSLKASISVLFQDYQVFSASIAENILMRPVIGTPEEIQLVNNALKFAGLYDVICRLPNGINTEISHEFFNSGAFFSGGEYQKIAVARMYAQNRNILILDEPSSNMDAISENELFKKMLEFSGNKTIILVTHKLSNVINADKIYFIDGGKIVESGTHDELIHSSGEYASMYNIQLQNYHK